MGVKTYSGDWGEVAMAILNLTPIPCTHEKEEATAHKMISLFKGLG